MQNLVRFHPLNEEFRHLPGLFQRFLGGAALDCSELETNGRSWAPRCDIQEKDQKILVSAEVPGVDRKDLEVQVEDNLLTISGSRALEKEDSSATAFRTERFHGSFSRSFTLPATVDTAAIEANLRDGILTVTLPKVETARARKITVSSR